MDSPVLQLGFGFVKRVCTPPSYDNSTISQADRDSVLFFPCCLIILGDPAGALSTANMYYR